VCAVLAEIEAARFCNRTAVLQRHGSLRARARVFSSLGWLLGKLHRERFKPNLASKQAELPDSRALRIRAYACGRPLADRRDVHVASSPRLRLCPRANKRVHRDALLVALDTGSRRRRAVLLRHTEPESGVDVGKEVHVWNKDAKQETVIPVQAVRLQSPSQSSERADRFLHDTPACGVIRALSENVGNGIATLEMI
jgi:hypothetical protein